MNRFPALLVVFLATGSAPAAPNLKARVVAAYAGVNRAYVGNRIMDAAGYFRPDYVCQLQDGSELRREEYLARLLAIIRRMTKPKCWTTIDAFKPLHSGATVVAHRFMMGGVRLSDGRLHVVKRIVKEEDVWTLEGKRLMLVHTKILASANYVDGKPGFPRVGGAGISGVQRAH